MPRCQRGPECGDGYACDPDGLCVRATGQAGDACDSEVACAPGLSCQLDPSVDDAGRLFASCTSQNTGRPAGSTCTQDGDCRNGTCALGHCVDVCAHSRDCGPGMACTDIPRVDPDSGQFRGMFGGCLASRGAVTWSIPVPGPSADILVPIPDAARSATIVFRVDDTTQLVGARRVMAPSDTDPGDPSYAKPCVPTGTNDLTCSTVIEQTTYYKARLRHAPAFGQSVLQIPVSPERPLEAGVYRIEAASFRPNGATGSAIPHVTAILKMDAAVSLDLHFYFLDLSDHPCEAAFGNARLDVEAARAGTFFQTDFLGQLRTIFAGGGVALGAITYEDIGHRPDLDGLALEDAGALLELGAHPTGINVFFVRTLSPVGLQAFGPNPGPAGLGGTRQSGVIIGLDTLCYRSWAQLARLTAHELARYMGLYHNVELEAGQYPDWRDPIADSDDSKTNLMFYSELGGIELSPGQRDILTKSAVLR